jgi:hypothetical protein
MQDPVQKITKDRVKAQEVECMCEVLSSNPSTEIPRW